MFNSTALTPAAWRRPFLVACLGLLIVLTCHGSAFGVVGVDHVRWYTSSPHITVEVDQEYQPSYPPRNDYTGFFIASPALHDNVYQWGGSFMDEGCSVYMVPFNAPLSRTEIANGTYTELVAGQNYDLSGTVYLGLYTGLYAPHTWGGEFFDQEAFGWVKLSGQNGQLTYMGHAVDYGDGGIYVGTTTPMPEPATLTLLAIGGAAMLRRSRL